MPQKQKMSFPKKFLWGVSTSAHQVEGENNNQWTKWEKENAKSLSVQASYQYGDLSSWEYSKSMACSEKNYISGRASNHYEMFEQDIELVRKMNMNAFRFSVEWSRIQPERGAWNAEAVQHYKQVLSACKKRNIEPIVTLFHFTLPIWFVELGGFEKRSNIKYFVSFAERILNELGNQVKYVITINEPEIYALHGYYTGSWPPQIQNKFAMRKVLINLSKAHNQISSILHKTSRRYKVAVSKNSAYIYPGDDAWISVRSASIAQYFQDDYFLKKVIKQSDFIGVNYYFSNRIYGYRIHNPNERLNDLGWDMNPDDIQHVLERLDEKYKKPIFITENGLADAKDLDRQWWIAKTIQSMNKAMKNGVRLIGYLHWSLTDNFEWDKGFWPKFGLFSVDYKTFKRTPRKSAIMLSKAIKNIREL